MKSNQNSGTILHVCAMNKRLKVKQFYQSVSNTTGTFWTILSMHHLDTFKAAGDLCDCIPAAFKVRGKGNTSDTYKTLNDGKEVR